MKFEPKNKVLQEIKNLKTFKPYTEIEAEQMHKLLRL